MNKVTYGDRIKTGIRNTTIANPGVNSGAYSGDPKKYVFNTIQSKNHERLVTILKRNGQKFDYIGAHTYLGGENYLRRSSGKKVNLTSFVVVSPSLVWQKYEGQVAGGGQNRVYVAGKMIKLTDFLALTDRQQDKLVKLDK